MADQHFTIVGQRDIEGKLRRLELRMPHVKLRRKLSALPGCTESSRDKRILRYPAEPLVLHDIQALVGDQLILATEVLDWIQRFEAIQHSAIRAIRAIESSSPTDSRLKPYQEVGVNWLRAIQRGILADDTGMGKTVQALESLKDIVDRNPNEKVLIIAPWYVHRHWAKHCETWLGVQAVIANGQRAQREKKIASAVNDPAVRVLIINHEMLLTTRQRIYLNLFNRRWCAVVMDEAHKFQNRASARSKGAAALRCERLIELTATPVFNRPHSIWHLLHLIDPHRFSSFWKFVESYCDILENPFGRVIGPIKPSEIERFHWIIAPYVLKREKSEVEGLPLHIPVLLEYDLEPDHAKAYNALRKQQKRDSCVNLAELRYMLNNPLDLDPDLYQSISPVKSRLLLNLIEDLPQEQKIVIFTWHNNYTLYLNELLTNHQSTWEEPRRIFRCHGVMDQTERDMHVAEFIRTSKPAILIGTMSTMGESIDGLQCASIAIFAEHPWLPAQVRQAIGRLERIGQKVPPTIYHLVANNTLEQYIWDVVEEKQEITTETLAVESVRSRILEEDDD